MFIVTSRIIYPSFTFPHYEALELQEHVLLML